MAISKFALLLTLSVFYNRRVVCQEIDTASVFSISHGSITLLELGAPTSPSERTIAAQQANGTAAPAFVVGGEVLSATNAIIVHLKESATPMQVFQRHGVAASARQFGEWWRIRVTNVMSINSAKAALEADGDVDTVHIDLEKGVSIKEACDCSCTSNGVDVRPRCGCHAYVSSAFYCYTEGECESASYSAAFPGAKFRLCTAPPPPPPASITCSDPLFNDQWHHGHANVPDAWNLADGSGINIVVVDGGVQTSHPDIDVISSVGWNILGSQDNGELSSISNDAHGTNVAGVAAGIGNNGIGGCGAAYKAKVRNVRLLFAHTVSADVDNGGSQRLTSRRGVVTYDSLEAEAIELYDSETNAVYTNSWGPLDDLRVDGPGFLMRAAMVNAIQNGRGGLGTLIVFAAGNGGYHDNANNDGYAGSRFTVTVGAVGDHNKYTSYSEPCACLHVVAPSNGGFLGITTSDLVGGYGSDVSDYTSNFGGTSSSTPLVAGAIALMIQVNPSLSWRDVQAILIATASVVDSADSGWFTNAAGLSFNNWYGAGMLDASAAVAAAQSWTTLAAQISEEKTTSPSEAIPDESEVVYDLTFTQHISLEHITLEITIPHSNRGDLDVRIESPHGTVSQMTTPTSRPVIGASYSGWTMSSNAHWGEYSPGTWKVKVRDAYSGNTGSVSYVSLVLYGTQSHAPPPPTPPPKPPQPASPPPSPPPPSPPAVGGEGDPHLYLGHGGRADFRGYDKTLFSFLSYPSLAVNVKTEDAKFNLNSSLIVDGSFMTEVHVVSREKGGLFTASYYASKLGNTLIGWVNGTCLGSTYRSGHNRDMTCGNSTLSLSYSSVTLKTPEWMVSIEPSFVYGWISGARKRLDLDIHPIVVEKRLRGKPHGILGQSFDGDDKPRKGKVDIYPETGTIRTTAMAEGAIEGSAKDYIVSSAYTTNYKYSQFSSYGGEL